MVYNTDDLNSKSQKAGAATGSGIYVRAWDLPVRIFHWGLAVSFGAAWLATGDRYLYFHLFAGTLIAGLLLFRLLWGWLGEPNARFRDFGFGWKPVWCYIRDLIGRHPPRFVGHNPAGSWIIWLMFALLLSLVITGALTLGGEERHGPFVGWVRFPVGVKLHQVHAALAWVMVGVVCAHLLGVLIESLLHRENLVASMVTGRKRSLRDLISVRRRGGVALSLVLAMLLFAAWWFQGYLYQTPGSSHSPLAGPELPDDPVWRKVCGECHLAYHPSLMPARSWEKLMQQSSDHFGEDLALEPKQAAAIRDFLVANSAEQEATEAAWKINSNEAASQAPLRITGLRYWKWKHSRIIETVWQRPSVNNRGNCVACHQDARQGTFEDTAIKVPKS